ncbi:hypothetical protein TRL7639_04290 [Falsiruegeria litorea R37]|uniref:Uncharacterized protein n=1 Tax=Falsiruegeria litorea R37 TaxID=1200284 RepID=A0A1Y5TTI6_9RHOB|nr:hypothetical protein [Falsiruegeria litorea]SLN72185.1 hypothetical protein TRL7639_04290 [Falsiruegeria litorea R37]
MNKGKDVVISPKEMESLAAKLESFSKELSPDEQTMLSAMVVLAGRQLAGMGAERVQINRDAERLGGLQAGFANSFSRFAPDAFPEPVGGAAVVAPGTVCIE